MPKIKVPRFNENDWTKNGNHVLEVLIGSQLLFLNNFCEPLCKKAKGVLKTIFDRLRCSKDELYIGEPIVDNETGVVTNYQFFTPDGLAR